MTTQTTNTIVILHGGGKSPEDVEGSVYRDFYSADMARIRFEKDLRSLGRNIPQTSIKKVSDGYRWYLK